MTAAHEKDQDHRSDERDGDGSEATEPVGKKGEHGCPVIALRGECGCSQLRWRERLHRTVDRHLLGDGTIGTAVSNFESDPFDPKEAASEETFGVSITQSEALTAAPAS